MDRPEKFCIAPFKAALIDRDGTLLPCCDYMTGEDRSGYAKISELDHWQTVQLVDLRKTTSEGKIDPGCDPYCIAKEKDPKYVNKRKFFNRKYPINDNILDYVEIRLSNYCNLKCTMCGSYASSSLAQEYRDHQQEYQSIGMIVPDEKTVRWWDDPKSLENAKRIVSTVSEIDLTGGEPLMVPETVSILESADPDKISVIRIITNLTKLNQRILDVIKRFKLVEITVSLEGIEEHNDYIRYGSKWSDILENIKIIKQLDNVKFSVNHVLQHTSIFALPRLVEFVRSNNIKLHLHEIYYGSYPEPGVLTLNSADSADVEKFKTWVEQSAGIYRKQLLTWLESYKPDQILHTKFHNYFAMLDQIRGLDFNKTFSPTI